MLDGTVIELAHTALEMRRGQHERSSIWRHSATRFSEPQCVHLRDVAPTWVKVPGIRLGE